jgi:adenosylmethionine-8-amino-7-oxononanoate aminotransferase
MNNDGNPARSTKEYQSIYAARHFYPMEDQKMMKADTTRVMVKAKGMYLWDSEGKRYLDGMAGLWCTAVGYGREELIEAATCQLQDLSYYSLFFNTTHPPVVHLSEKIFELLPKNYSRIVYTNSGSEANEVLIRTVRRYWETVGKREKKILIARDNGYHGSTVGSASLGGFKFMHEMGDLPIPNIHHIGEPYWYGYQGELTEEEFGLKSAQELEAKILALGADKVAAFVAEPFQGAGGMIFPPATYWPEIQRVCRKYDVLLCADEVIGGFGRTGEWFAHQHFGFEPDTITVAKGLTSGYIPMGGLILSRRVAETVAEQGGVFAHGLTYQGHPVAAAVGLANLKLLDEGGIVNTVKSDTGPYLQNALREVFTDHPLVGEIHGAGAVAALQFARSKAEKKRFEQEGRISLFCARSAFDEGLIVRASIGRIIISPALIATRLEIDELVSKLKRAVDRTAKELRML